MTFDWLIRHQKKILFVMAVVLMVGWGFGSILMRLLPRKGSGGGPGEVIFRLAGEDVTHGEYLSFRASWTKVFRDLSREGMQQRFGRDVHPVNVMLAYMALHRMAEKCNIYVDDETLVSSRGR